MKKTIITLLFFAIISVVAASAQIRIEPFLGVTFPTRDAQADPLVGPQFGLTAFKELNNSALSIGAEAYVSVALREGDFKNNGSTDQWALRTISLLSVTEWRFLQLNKSIFYAGLGVGICNRTETLPGFANYKDISSIGFCCSPRVGARISDRFTISLNLSITEKDYNTVGLRLGYAFGKRASKEVDY